MNICKFVELREVISLVVLKVSCTLLKVSTSLFKSKLYSEKSAKLINGLKNISRVQLSFKSLSFLKVRVILTFKDNKGFSVSIREQLSFKQILLSVLLKLSCTLFKIRINY